MFAMRLGRAGVAHWKACRAVHQRVTRGAQYGCHTRENWSFLTTSRASRLSIGLVSGSSNAAVANLTSQSIGTASDEAQLPFYAAYPLDRAAEQQGTVAEQLQGARILPVLGSQCLVRTPAPSASDGSVQPVQLPFSAELLGDQDADLEPIFLGADGAGVPYFAIAIKTSAAQQFADHHKGEWRGVRQLQLQLSAADAALLAVATGLCTWHKQNLYSPITGAATQASNRGRSRKDPATGKSFYPRIDPAVIMAVTCGPWCLLGRKAEWRAGMYSTLAGFLEIGETLEMCVLREVKEESNVDLQLSSVRYHGSQPWPFPQSLMVGFFAKAAPVVNANSGTGLELLTGQARDAAMQAGVRPDEITELLLPALQPTRPAEDELEDVRWFHVDYLHASVAGTASSSSNYEAISIPGRTSMSNMLISSWLKEIAATPWAGSEFPQVQIDEGTFKYVLMRLADADGNSKLLVWGDRRAAYHNNVLERANFQARKIGLRVDVLGGGRIEHNIEQKTILVYGFSQAFRPAPHELSVALLRKWYPLYDPQAITLSYEGY